MIRGKRCTQLSLDGLRAWAWLPTQSLAAKPLPPAPLEARTRAEVMLLPSARAVILRNPSFAGAALSPRTVSNLCFTAWRGQARRCDLGGSQPSCCTNYMHSWRASEACWAVR